MRPQTLLRSEQIIEKIINAVYFIIFVKNGVIHVLHEFETLYLIPEFSHSIPVWLLYMIFSALTIWAFQNHKVHRILHIAGILILIVFTVTTIFKNLHYEYSVLINLDIALKDLTVLSLTHKPIAKIFKVIKAVKNVGVYLLPIFTKLISVLPFIYFMF